MRHTKFNIIAFLLISPLLLMAQQNNWKEAKNPTEILGKIKSRSDQTTSLKCNFDQEKVMKAFSDKMLTRGIYYYQKPDMLRWEFTTPFSSVMVINKQKVYFQENQKTSNYDMGANKLFREISNLMSGMVQGTLFNDTRNYQVKVFENKTAIMVELKPVSSSLKEYVQVIYLYFNNRDYTIEKVKLVEPSEDYTLITFSNKKFNTVLSPSLFKL